MKRELTYHHIGIPTEIPREDEVYLEQYKMFVSGFETSRLGVEWIRFEEDAPFPDLVKTVPHVAFVVDDLEKAIADQEILIYPNSPSEGVTVAFIVENGAPIEFLEFDGPEFEVWPGSAVEDFLYQNDPRRFSGQSARSGGHQVSSRILNGRTEPSS